MICGLFFVLVFGMVIGCGSGGSEGDICVVVCCWDLMGEFLVGEGGSSRIINWSYEYEINWVLG